jgi:branched-chain amino acid transport system permease protein
MLVVVGGAGYVGGALFAGVGLQGLLPLTVKLFPSFAKLQTITPGLIGISLGKQPSGAAPQFSAGLAELRDDTPVLVTMLAGLAVAWGLRLGGVYEGWGMVAVMAAVFVIAALIARVRASRAAVRALDEAGTSPGAALALDGKISLEWVGVTVPWTAERLAEVDSHLYLADVTPDPTPDQGPGLISEVDASREAVRAPS